MSVSSRTSAPGGGYASQRAYQSEDMTLRMRRPPEEYVSLLAQNEQEFRSYVHTFEDNPLFNRLIKDGVVHKVRLRGKIPREKYEEFMDAQLMAFLVEYSVESFEGWERDFLSPLALSRVGELAEKYHIPEGTLLKHLRYIRSSDQGSLLSSRLSRGSISNSSYSSVESASGSEMVDLSETIEATREFVERYEVSEQDFLDLILSGETSPEDLAKRFGCSLLEAEELLDSTDRVYLAQTYEDESQSQPRNRTKVGGEAREEAVAFVQIVEGRLSIQFDHDSIYAQRYRIRRDQKVDADLSGVAREFLTRARFINQRLSALSRLITTLCNQQLEYLGSGEMRHLKPLAQAELARQLGEHPSTVSRLIRGKSIETPWGKMPLLFLCQSKTDVVARLIGEFPHLTDQAVVSRLREDFDCMIARRTVAYHRGKRVRRNKRHKTAGDTTETANADAANATAEKTSIIKASASKTAAPKNKGTLSAKTDSAESVSKD